MDFIHLFLREQRLTAVAIDGNAIHALSFGRHRVLQKGAHTIASHGTSALSLGIIEEGQLVNVRVLGETLKELWKKTKPLPITTPFVVLSLPSALFHFQPFTLPASLSRREIGEVMGTQMGFTLPLATDLMYFDWEEVPPRAKAHREIFFVWARRAAIDPYLAACRDAACVPVAIEPHYVSILRTLVLPKDERRIIAIVQQGGVTVLVYESGGVRFVRVIPWERHALSRAAVTPEEARTPSAERIVAIVSDEIRRVMLFYESSEGAASKPVTYTLLPIFPLPSLAPAISSELAIAHAPPVLHPSLSTLTTVKPEHRAYPVFGAAQRASMPRKLDTIVSIMPVGTETLYERTKALAFTHFLHDFALVFSGCFALLFILMAVGFSFFARKELGRMQTQGNFTLPADLGGWERDATSLNTSVDALSAISREQPSFAALTTAVLPHTTARVTITKFSADRTSSTVQLDGKAEDLQALLDWKKALEASQLFARVDLPLSVFTQEGEIPFSLSLVVGEYQQLLSSHQ